MGSDQDSADSFSDLAGTTAGLLAQLGHAPAVPLDDLPLAPGTLIGDNFEITGRLGAGGMAVVYLARDRQLERPVAIKLQRRPTDPHGLSRALREAMAMARLSHPNVLTVHEIGEFGPRIYIVTEHIDGWNARDWLAAQRPGFAAILDLYLRAGEGLAAAHAVGIVHRDFKPDNVLVGRDGRVRVADFGLARTLRDVPSPNAPAPAARGARDTTIAGTLAYMPPEQRAGRHLDARADQFAFCVTLHEALTGRLPDGERGSLPAWLDRVLRRGRDPDPARRFPSMTALLAALRRDARAARNRRLVRGGGTLVLGLSLAGAAGLFDRPPLCLDVAAPLRGVWDGPRGDALAAAFAAACSRPGTCPEGLVTHTRALLDGYARAWTDARLVGCEATHLHGVQSPELLDRRMLCLDERLRALDALVSVLLAADADVAAEAASAVARLPSLAACADPAHLMARLAPPADPRLESPVAGVRERLAEVEALGRAGRQPAALAVARSLVPDADALAYPPLQAELALARGQLLWQTDPSTSERHLLDAYFLATASDHHAVAARAAIALVWTTGYAQSRPDVATLWSRHALAETERRGTDVQLRGDALNAVASMHAAQGRDAEALALQDQALAQIEPTGLSWATLLNNRAATLDALGRYAEASAGYEQVLAEERRLFGDIHPRVAATLTNLGLVRMRQGQPEAAVQLQQQALTVFDAAHGPGHELRWQLQLNLGIALIGAGRPDQALAPIDDALALATRVLGPDHPDLALCLSARASALQHAHRAADAIAPALAALTLLERSYGPDHAEVLVQQSLLGQVLAAADRPDEALTWLTRAIAGWDARGDLEHPSLADALVEQGELLRRMARPDAAVLAFTRAIAIAERGEVSPELLARARAGLQPAP